MIDHIHNSAGAVEATVADLIATRLDRKVSGFAPGGKVTTHQFGTNRSVFRGCGMEFDEARIYQPGDDVRTIDWRVTARTGQVYTKLYHEERERPVFILLDCRSMMHFGTRVRFKSVLAARLAARLCWVGIDGGDRVGGFILTQDGIKDFVTTRTRHGMLGFLSAMSAATHTVDTASAGTEIPLHMAVRRLRHVAHPGTLAFIISDFNDLDEPCVREIKRLSLHSHVTNIHIYDQLDARLPGSSGHRITDGQDVLSLSTIGRSRIQSYRKMFIDRTQRLEKMCRQRGMALHTLSTADDTVRVLRPYRTGMPQS